VRKEACILGCSEGSDLEEMCCSDLINDEIWRSHNLTLDLFQIGLNTIDIIEHVDESSNF